MTVESLDAVPEAIRSQYVKAEDGKSFRLDLEGFEDPAGLKSALEKERTNARAAAKTAQAWAGLGKTPEEIQALVEAQRKAEEEKATKGGEWDKLKAQMTAAHQAELAKRDERAGSLTASLKRLLVDAAATAAIASAKGHPELLLPIIDRQVKVVEEDGEFVARVMDKAGSPRVNGKGEFLTIADLVSEMRQSDVYGRAFDPVGNSGAGAQGSQGSGAGKVLSEAAFNALPPKERAKRMSEGYRVAA